MTYVRLAGSSTFSPDLEGEKLKEHVCLVYILAFMLAVEKQDSVVCAEPAQVEQSPVF